MPRSLPTFLFHTKQKHWPLHQIGLLGLHIAVKPQQTATLS